MAIETAPVGSAAVTSQRRLNRHSSSSRGWFIVGALLALPLSIHVAGGSVSLAQGHVEARVSGTYFPMGAPIAVALTFAMSRRLRGKVAAGHVEKNAFRAAFLVLTLMLAAFVGAVHDPRYPALSALPFLLQAILPFVVFVLLTRRTVATRQRESLMRGFEAAALGLASLCLVLRPVLSYRLIVGYPDDFGPVGIPTSLRFFPTIVSLACVSAMVRAADPRTGVQQRIGLLVLTLGGLGLIVVSHSRTALVGVVFGFGLLLVVVLKRSRLMSMGLVMAAMAVAMLVPNVEEASSLDRLILGSGESDTNRATRVVDSLASSFHEPFGQKFVPSVDARPGSDAQMLRVVTAENQFGTFGASAGPAALLASLVFTIGLSMRSWRSLRVGDRDRRAASAVVLVLLIGSLFQINMSHAHLGLVMAVYSWLVVTSPSLPSDPRVPKQSARMRHRVQATFYASTVHAARGGEE